MKCRTESSNSFRWRWELIIARRVPSSHLMLDFFETDIVSQDCARKLRR